MVVEIQRPAWMDAARTHLERADELDRAGQYMEALVECRRALEIDPSLAAEANVLSGRLLAELERPREALSDYRKGLRAAGGSAEARQLVSGFGDECLTKATRVYEESEDYDRALNLCEVALEVNPRCAEAYDLRGLLLEEFGQIAKASVCYRRAIALDPTCDSAIENLARLEEGAGEADEEAEPGDAELDGRAVTDTLGEAEVDASEGTVQESVDWAGSDRTAGTTQTGTQWFLQWLGAFGRVLFRPSVATFQGLAISADTSVFTCAAWLAVAAAATTLFDVIVLRNNPMGVFYLYASPTILTLILLGFRMLVIPGLVMLFVFWVDSYRKWVFRSRISYYRETLYVVTVVYIALIPASKVLALIPTVGSIVTWVTYTYLLVLTGMAVRGITGLSAGKAAVTVIAAGVVMVALVAGVGLIAAFLLVVLIR
jgi:hypothetical protein